MSQTACTDEPGKPALTIYIKQSDRRQWCLVTWILLCQQYLNPLDTKTEPQRKDLNEISQDWCIGTGNTLKGVCFLLFYCTKGKNWKKWKERLAESKKGEEQRLSWGKSDHIKWTTGQCLHTHSHTHTGGQKSSSTYYAGQGCVLQRW